MMKRSLTLLQRVIVQRLRERHLHDVADAARAAWSEGRIAKAPPEVLGGGPTLLRDFDRANKQAATPQALSAAAED
jgi:hypothetical protein